MNPFEMVVLIVLLGVIGSVINNAIKSRENKRHGDAASDEADELRDLISALEDRIQVLERIVTDTGSRENLKRQFRDLER